MRISRTLPTVAVGVAVAALLVPTAAKATAGHPVAAKAPACTTWHAMDVPPGGLATAGKTFEVAVDAVAPGDVWFPAMAGGESTNLRWDGHAFQVPAQLPPPPPATFRDLVGASFDSSTDGWMLYGYMHQFVGTSADEVPAIGARWHDGRWTVTPLAASPDPGQGAAHPVAVASLSADDAWAVGSWGGNLVPADAGTLVEHWDGTRWSLVPDPAGTSPGAYFNAVAVVSATDIWAVGGRGSLDASTPLVEHWDGSTWSSVTVPSGTGPTSSLLSVSADGPDDVWATGLDGTSDSTTALVEHWNGRSWTVVTGLPDVGTGPGLGEVALNLGTPAVYAASPDNVWVTFQPMVSLPFGQAAGVGTPGTFLHWDGSTWTSVPLPVPGEADAIYSLDGIGGTGPGDVWAVGTMWLQSNDATAFPFVRQVFHLTCG